MGRFSIKIFFRYLFLRLLVPFAVCLGACTLIWVMVDLYGNLDDFLEHKTGLLVVLRFYSLQIPSMLVQVLPAALLFSTLWALLSLNRRSELVAFQAGAWHQSGSSPLFVFALIWVIILAVDLNWPAARAEVTRDRLLAQVKGQSAKNNVFVNLIYVDKNYYRVWFFQNLDTNQNKAKGLEILQRDASGHDLKKYFAQTASWTGEFWRLHGVVVINYAYNGGVQDQKTYQELDLPDITTTPKQLSLIVSQPEQLTVSQLSQYISSSTATPEHLAKYRTEWWYRVLHPFTLIVLMLFALLQGLGTDRRSAMTGIAWILVVFILYVVVMHVFIAAGRFHRLPPFIAVVATEVIFGGIGVYLLGMKYGWGWQILDHAKRWKAQWDAAGRDDQGMNYLADILSLLKKDWPGNRTVNIVCHGHSVPSGYFKTPVVDTMNSYPHLLHVELARRFPHAVTNVIVTGIGGETSERGAARFEHDVLTHRPDVLTIDYSLNDRRLGLEKAHSAWSAMIEQALGRSIKIILLTPTGDLDAELDDPNDLLNQHAEQVRNLAAHYQIGLADSLAATKAAINSGIPLQDLMSQVNHPNRRGHDVVAGELVKFFGLN